MSGDLKDKLAAALKIKVNTACYIQQVYDLYKRSMSGMQIKTPLPETVHLCDENFVYWIKLQWHDPKTNSWHDASPAMVLPLLEAGTFDEKGYRLEDPRRARVLPHLPTLLRLPERIYENVRCHGRKCIRGKHVYVQEYKGQLKVAFTLYDPKIDKVIVVSSFWTTKNWLATCVEEPPLYQKKKATP
jgi:hypothetical protein